jgi:hypothetical protein
VSVKNSSDKEIPLFISHSLAIDKLMADNEYGRSFKQAIDDGFMTVEETTKMLRSRGLLNDEEEDSKIKAIESKIAGQESILEKMVRVPYNRDRVKANIETLKKEILKILSKKEERLEYCAERKAQEEKFLYLTWRSVRDPYSMDLFWPTKEKFNTERDLILRRNVFSEYVKLYSGTDATTIRYIARSNLWRVKYITSVKTHISLFNRDLPDYSVDQQALAYWSHFYQSVYDMPSSDAPSEGIIEDDTALDAFMKSYMADKNRENTQAREKNKNRTGKTAWDFKETIVTKSNPGFKDIEYSPTIESVRNKDKNVLNVKK